MNKKCPFNSKKRRYRQLFTFKLQVIINTIWLKERLDNATDLPRFHHQLIPNEMEYERFFDEVTNIYV